MAESHEVVGTGKKKAKKKRKSNQSSVDFVIVSSEKPGEVKEVVKKKKRKAEETAEQQKTKPKKATKKKREATTSTRRDNDEKKEEVTKAVPKDEGLEQTDATNPGGVTRLFVGNLPWSVTDSQLEAALGCKLIIKYITDKTTKQFYGSAFVDCGDAIQAARLAAKSGMDVGGRPAKIALAPPRPGDIWPPRKKETRAKQTRPEGGTTKLFVGNVAYEASEDDVVQLFEKVAPEGLKAVRWLTDKATDEFRGSGFVEFNTCAEADKAMAEIDGVELKGRRIRLDYAG